MASEGRPILLMTHPQRKDPASVTDVRIQHFREKDINHLTYKMNLTKCSKYFFTPVISGVVKLTLFVAARNVMSKCPIIWRGLGKSHGDISTSPCVTPGILLLILYFLPSPGNTHLSASLTLLPSSRHYTHCSPCLPIFTSELLPTHSSKPGTRIQLSSTQSRDFYGNCSTVPF